MLRDPATVSGSDDLDPAEAPPPGTDSVSADDLEISAQARSLSDLDRILDRIVRRDGKQDGALLDLGCGMGGLAKHVGGRLGLTQLIGVDLDPDRLKAAAARGVKPLLLDLNEEPLPLEAGSVRAVTCFGLLAYLALYDNTMSEAARVLEDGGWFLLSMPDLASYSNRLALLLGYQPFAVAVSRLRQAGTMSRRRDASTSANMPPLLHGATLRCMKELLDNYGFDTVAVRGFTPADRRRRPVIDDATSRFASVARRFLILGRKRPTAG